MDCLNIAVDPPGPATRVRRRPESAGDGAGFAVHPAISDGCLQSLIAAGLGADSPVEGTVSTSRGPSAGSRVARRSAHRWCHARLTAVDNGELIGSVLVVAEDGEPVVELARVRARLLDKLAMPAPITDALLEPRWETC